MGNKLGMRTGAPLLILTFFLAGATCEKGPATTAALHNAPGRITVTGVWMPESNQLKITADGKMKASVFNLTDPLRVGVEISNALYEQTRPAPIPPGGIVERVEITTETKMLRPVVKITAYLKGPAVGRLEGEGPELLFIIEPQGPVVSAGEGDNIIPYKETRDMLQNIVTGMAPPGSRDYYHAGMELPSIYEYDLEYAPFTPLPYHAPIMPPPGPDGSATVVGDIFYRTIRRGFQILIYLNGPPSSWADYDQTSPPRIICDFLGVSSHAGSRTYTINYAGIRGVRLAEKHDRTTVQIDFSRTLPAYDINRTSSGVVITVFEHKYIPGGIRSESYVTAGGETFRQLAVRFYANPAAWRRLYAANRGLFTRPEAAEIREEDGDVPLGAGIRLVIPLR